MDHRGKAISTDPIKPPNREEDDRVVDLGISQKLARWWLGENVTLMKTIYISMVLNITMSLSDTASDLAVAIQLIYQGEYRLGLAVILIDYLPMWHILLHSATSKAWKTLESPKERWILCFILVFAPIAFPLLQLRWMLNFHIKSKGVFNFLHQNVRLAELIAGTLESPMQFIFMLMLYSHGKLPLPWENSTIIEDSLGNQLNLGGMPGVFSLFLSSITIVKNAVDVAEARSIKESAIFSAFSFMVCIFRISGYTVTFIILREFSVLMFVLIAFVSLTAIIRFDKSTARQFSLITTFIIGIFIPSAISGSPHEIQYIAIKTS